MTSEPQAATGYKGVDRVWDLLAEAYALEYVDELRFDSHDRQMLDTFVALAHRGQPVVDLGCGPGHVTRYLAKAGLAMYGIDVSSEMLRIASTYSPELTFERGDLTTLTWTQRSLGGAVAWYSIVHMTRTQVADLVQRIAIGLRPAAPLLIGTHSGQGMSKSRNVLGQGVDLDITLFSERELRDTCAAKGFRIIDSTSERRGAGSVAYVLAAAAELQR